MIYHMSCTIFILQNVKDNEFFMGAKFWFSPWSVPKLANKLFAQVNHSAQAINYLSLFYGKSNIKDKGMFLEVSV